MQASPAIIVTTCPQYMVITMHLYETYHVNDMAGSARHTYKVKAYGLSTLEAPFFVATGKLSPLQLAKVILASVINPQ